MKISELRPRVRVDTTFKVLEKNEPRVTRAGKRVAEVLVGDDSVGFDHRPANRRHIQFGHPFTDDSSDEVRIIGVTLS